jgi:D-sedoheptulose 7-phosphate isomerase
MSVESIEERIASILREGAELRLRLAEACAGATLDAARAIERSLRDGGKLLLFGNGGSAADAQHIAAEFVCRFARDRDPLPAIALTTDTSILTAVSNDYGFEHVFARQIYALGRAADVALGISTSGRSPNVIKGIEAARARGLKTIALTGKDGGPLERLADIAMVVPSSNTALIQECHIVFGHILCETAETLLLGEAPSGSSDGNKKVKSSAASEKQR